MYSRSTYFPSSEWALAQDDKLVERVVARLRSRLGSPVRNFQISARLDGLILRGEVRSHYGKQMAQEVAMEVSGLSILSNDIEVHFIDLVRDECIQ
jgi:osmotically-inducible protein OsmY